MKTHRISTLLIATLVLSSAGCGGSRLRGLLTRSDYQTLDELENDETTLLSEDDRSSTVSRQRILAESEESDSDDGASEKQPSRRGLFNLAGFLRGRDADEEITTDPFVETPADKVRTADLEGSDDDNKVRPISAENARTFVEEAARAEDTAESLIREVATERADERFVGAFEDARSVFEEERLPEVKPADNSNPAEQSFADFLAEKSAEVREAAEDVAEMPVVEAQDLKQDLTTRVEEQAEKTVSAFDQLLGSADSSDAEPELSGSELFPALDELLPEEPQEVAGPPASDSFSPFDELLAPTQDREPQSPEQTFEVAAANHGFTAQNEPDPWSEFRNARPVSSTKPVEAGFSWGDEDSEVAQQSETADSAPVFDEYQPVAEAITPAAIESQPSAPEFDVTLPAPAEGLTIPPSPPQGVDATVYAESAQENPFADAVSGTPDSDEEVQTPVETTAGFSFSSRTWFLLLGCVIVGLLLFMPERKNQTNA